MVGKEVVEGSSEISTLQEGAGETVPLKAKGNFERSPHPGIVYFVRAGDAIKIGFATNLKDRLSTLQTSHPEDLEVVAAISAVHVDEYATHQRFAHLRVRGEWFRADRELLQFIEYAKLKFGEAAPHKPAPKRRPVPKATKQPTAIDKLSALRVIHGPDTPIGHRCSGLIQMIPTFQTSTDPAQRAFLAVGIERKMADLAKLVAVA